MLFHSTRGNDSGKDFATILMQGLADDGGIEPQSRALDRSP